MLPAHFSYSRSSRRNAPNTLPLVGNGLQFLQPRQHLFDWFTECIRLRGHETLRIAVPTLSGGVIVADPAIVEHVFKHVDVFQKGEFFKGKLRDLFGDGILNADGELWRRQRRAGAQLLSAANLAVLADEVLPGLLGQAARTLGAAAESGEAVDLDGGVVQELTTRLMGRTVYGMEMHAGDDFSAAFDYVSGAAAGRFQNPLWFLFEPFTGARLRAASRVIKANGAKLVSHAIAAHNKRRVASVPSSSPSHEAPSSAGEASSEKLQHISQSFLGSLFEALGTEKLVADSAQAFLSAGRDTVAQALAWTFYLLLRHPRVADRVRQMVDTAFAPDEDDESPTSGFHPERLDSAAVSYITAVFYESTRLFPPLPFQLREVQQDATLPDGTFLPQGSILVWCPWAMGRSPLTWGDDADEFRPERWLDGGGRFQQRSPGEFPVFHGGPRQCLGKNLAETLAVRVVATTLALYDLEPAFKGDKTSRTHLTLPMDGGLEVYVKKRLRLERV